MALLGGAGLRAGHGTQPGQTQARPVATVAASAATPSPASARRSRAAPSAVRLRAVEAGVVDVDTVLDRGRELGAGTGIVLTPDGTVLTNDHVVAGAQQVIVTDVGNGRTYRAVVLGIDPAHDVAVLRAVGAAGLAAAPLASGSSPTVGDRVAGVGNAGGVGGVPSVVPGVVTGLGRQITARDVWSTAPGEQLTDMIATSAPLRPGDSGGPLVDSSGRVVGMDTAAAADASSGYAIPIGRALAVARAIA
jgi:S1-C subfamily serine protease